MSRKRKVQPNAGPTVVARGPAELYVFDNVTTMNEGDVRLILETSIDHVHLTIENIESKEVITMVLEKDYWHKVALSSVQI